MRQPVSSFKFKSFEYDFSIDGGSIGNYFTGIYIPVKAIMFYTITKVISTITDGGAGLANFHLGYIGNLTFLDALSPSFWGVGVDVFHRHL